MERTAAILVATAATAGPIEVPAAEADARPQTSLTQLAQQALDTAARLEHGKGGPTFMSNSSEIGKNLLAQVSLSSNADLAKPNLTLDNITEINVKIDRELAPSQYRPSLKELEMVSFYRDENGKWNAAHEKVEKETPDATDGTVVLGRRVVAHYTEYDVNGKSVIANSSRSTNPKLAQKTMQRLEDRAASLLETVAAAAPSPQEVLRRRQADQLASELSQELYGPNASQGVPVTGILNGRVKTEVPSVNGSRPNYYSYPVILNKPKRGLNGAWVGIPSTNQYGQVFLSPVKIQLGDHYGADVSLELNDKREPVLDNAGIYISHQDNKGPDMLYGYDRTGEGRFNSVWIETYGMK